MQIDAVLRLLGFSPVVKICGGLGNQMFQYAFARSLGTRTRLDISWFSKLHPEIVTPRNYELDRFNITLRPISRIGRKVVRLLPKIGEDELLRYEGGGRTCRYYGYFQDESLFRDIRGVLLREFSLMESPGASYDFWQHRIAAADCSVSVHIRRGDYMKSDIGMNSLGMEYYTSAMAMMRRSLQRPRFFIFSDDRPFVKDHFRKQEDVTVVDADTSCSSTDMMLMAKCNHNIVANSSYSWWGAWLNANETKTVVAPSPSSWYKSWYTNGRPAVLPAEWIVI